MVGKNTVNRKNPEDAPENPEDTQEDNPEDNLEENPSIALADNIQSFEASDLKMMFTIYHKQRSNLSVRITQNQYIYIL